jgi:hypothetical protein
VPARSEPIHQTAFDYDKLTKTFFVWCKVSGCRWTANRVPTMQDAKAKGDRHTANPKAR